MSFYIAIPIARIQAPLRQGFGIPSGNLRGYSTYFHGRERGGLKTDRKKSVVQQAAKQLGFASLSDMINRRRIDYVCQQLRKDPNTPIQTLFIDAGYRSRTTAWRHFTSIVGCTPREFVERQPDRTENNKILQN